MSDLPSRLGNPTGRDGVRDEGRRVARNAASFGAFLAGPAFMALLSRALGPAGYGRWWWSFGILEGAGIVGMLASDLWVRREIPRLVRAGEDVEPILDTVGAGVALAGATGLISALVLARLAGPLAAAQGDAALVPYLLVLSLQPLLWNLSNLLAAALQSLDVLGSIALVRGVLQPALQLGGLLLAWRLRLPATTTLLSLLAASALSLVATAWVYARHLPLGRTLARALRPRRLGDALRYGLTLLPPSVLWTLGGKLDLYVLRAHVGPETVGIYAACLHAAAVLPNLRMVFDPIAQAQVAALSVPGGDAGLAPSLQRMTRLCLLVLLPPFVLLVAIGEPALGCLLGRPAIDAAAPLAILAVGQLLGSMAIASWLVPMTLPGALLVGVAAASLLAKGALLFALVPAHPVLGAAIATAIGTVVAMQGQALVAAWRLHLTLRPVGLASLLTVGAVSAVAGHLVYASLSRPWPSWAMLAGGVSALLPLLLLAPRLLAADERTALRALLRR